MPLRDVKYKANQSILQVYGCGGHRKIRVVTMRYLRTAGIEEDADIRRERGTVNDVKLDESICRTKSKIFELAYCNPWDYFFTATLDPQKYDRTNLCKFRNDLKDFIKYQNKKFERKTKYLLVPEKHSDNKSYHMHGLLYDLPETHLHRFQIGDTMGKKLAEKVKHGDVVFNWLEYQKKFGFCDLEPIRNCEAISKYITKYINKNLYESVTDLNKNKYFHSLGLNGAVTVKKGTLLADITPTFENEYCSVAWLDYSEETLKQLLDSFADTDY